MDGNGTFIHFERRASLNLISQTIPAVIFAFIGGGISTAFIPLYSKIERNGGKLSADRYTSNLVNSVLVFSTMLVVVILLFTKPVVKMFAAGFTGETLELTVNFTRIGAVGLYFTAMIHIFGGYLRLHNHYIVPELIGFPSNVIIIVGTFISYTTNVYVLVIASVAATFVQFAVLIPSIRKTNYRHDWFLKFNDPKLRTMAIIALPVILGRSIDQINVLVDRTMASQLAVGGISVLNYASKLNRFVEGIFVASIITVMYPMIAKMAANDDLKALKVSVSESISIINVLVLPSTLGLMIFSREVIGLLFGRGAFTQEALNITGDALFYYAIGMFTLGRRVLYRAFYALQDTRTPMIVSSVAVVVNIIFNVLLSRVMGISGLALATSISCVISSILMLIALRVKVGPLGLSVMAKSFLKICTASIIMGVLAYLAYSKLSHTFGQNASLLIAITIGALSYSVVIYFMRIPEVDQILISFQKRISRKDVDGNIH